MNTDPTPADKANNIRHLLKLYQDQTGSEDEHLVSDFLTDLAHWCDAEDKDLADALSAAEDAYLEEVEAGTMLQTFCTTL